MMVVIFTNKFSIRLGQLNALPRRPLEKGDTIYDTHQIGVGKEPLANAAHSHRIVPCGEMDIQRAISSWFKVVPGG